MQFSNTTSLEGIIQNIEVMTDLGSAYISGNSTRLKEFTNLVNRVGHRVWHTIFMASGNWQYDDGNQTDLPSGVTDLSNGTSKYSIPSDALTVQRIDVKDNAGNWYKLYPMTKEELSNQAVDEYMKNDGHPVSYRLVGNTIELFPATNYDSTGGMKVYFDRASVEFDSTDTTSTPGFASPYHEIIPIGASIEWLKIKQPASPTLQLLMNDYAKLDDSIRRFYGKRFKDYKPTISRVKQSYA